MVVPCALNVDFASPPVGVLLRGEPLDGYGSLIGVAEIAVPVGERELQRLGYQMDRLGGPEPQARYVKAFEDVQRLRKQRTARRARPHSDHLIAAIGRTDWLTLLYVVALQVFKRQNAAVAAHFFRNAPPQIARVEQVGALPGDGPKRIRIIGPNESRSFFTRQALVEKNVG